MVRWCIENAEPAGSVLFAAAMIGAARVAPAQQEPSVPSAFLSGSVSNKSLSVTVGSAKRRALLVAGFAQTIGQRDQTVMLGGGAAFKSRRVGTRVLLETLLGSSGWTGRLDVTMAAAVGEGSVLSKVDLSQPLRSAAGQPSVNGYMMFFGKLSPHFGWGAVYQFTGSPGMVAHQNVGPGLEARILRSVFIAAFGRGMGRSGNMVSVWARLAR